MNGLGRGGARVELQQEIVTSLREMAGRGVTPSQMLREVLLRTKLEEPRSAMLALYCREAFGLEAHQMNAIFYWSFVGIGDLSDTQVDKFLNRHIQEAESKRKPPQPAAQD
jgi:hypothetical protein